MCPTLIKPPIMIWKKYDISICKVRVRNAKIREAKFNETLL